MRLLEKKDLPQNFIYPLDFIKIIDQNLINITPWHIIVGDELKGRYEGLKSRFPARNLIPFACRNDNDDVACFEVENRGIVHIIHDFANTGYEQRETFNSFWLWFRKAIEDMIEYEP